MKTLKRYLTFALCSLVFFSSCSKEDLQKATEMKVNIPDFSLKITPTVGSNDVEKSATADLQSFTGSATLSSTDTEFGILSVYLDKVNSITFSNVIVNISSTKGTIVKDLTLKVSDLSEFVIDSYTMGTDYSTTELKNYLNDILLNVMKKGSITTTISGKTDVPAGDKLNIDIKFQGIVARVSLIS